MQGNARRRHEEIARAHRALPHPSVPLQPDHVTVRLKHIPWHPVPRLHHQRRARAPRHILLLPACRAMTLALALPLFLALELSLAMELPEEQAEHPGGGEVEGDGVAVREGGREGVRRRLCRVEPPGPCEFRSGFRVQGSGFRVQA